MTYVWMLFSLACYFQNEDAIMLPLGSPPLDLPLTSLSDGRSINFNTISENTFFIFLSPACGYCKDAYSLAKDLQEKYNSIILLSGTMEEARTFMAGFPETTVESYVIMDSSLLEKPNITTFPAILAYKKGKLKLSMHGPLNSSNIDFIIELYEKGFKNPNK